MAEGTSGPVLITGGTGFLGSRLTRSYLEGGTSVRVVARGAGARRATDASGSAPAPDVVQLDLSDCDVASAAEAFSGHSIVVHTAAIMHARSPVERALQERVNVGATRTVVEACRRAGVPRLVHVSSTAAIGITSDPDVPADENLAFNLDHPDLTYSSTKHRAERLVLDANDGSLATTVVNPGFMLGRHRAEYRGLEVIDRVLRRCVVLCTHGGLSVVHVDDVVDGIRRVSEYGQPGERYILSGENLSFRAIAQVVCKVAGEHRLVLQLPDLVRSVIRMSLGTRSRRDPRLYLCRAYAYPYYSSEKARAELGYDARPFSAIVADALAFKRRADIDAPDYASGLTSET